MSWEIIIPFLRPIEGFIRDPEISDILVNGSAGVFIERQGQMQEVPVMIPEKSLQVAVRNIARTLGDEIDGEKPHLDSRLPDGSRVAAVFPPCGSRAQFWRSASFTSAFIPPNGSQPTGASRRKCWRCSGGPSKRRRTF